MRQGEGLLSDYNVPPLLLDLRADRAKLSPSEMAKKWPPNLLWSIADETGGVTITRAFYIHAMIEAGFVGEKAEPNFEPFAVCPICGYIFG